MLSESESMPVQPNVHVFELAAATVASRALWVAAELGVADHLDFDRGRSVISTPRRARWTS